MRKTLTIALLAVFMVGITGLLATSSSVDENEVVVEFSTPFNIGQINDYLREKDHLTKDDLDGVEKVIIVTPEGIEDGTYEVKNSETEGKVLVIVDPIHVTE